MNIFGNNGLLLLTKFLRDPDPNVIELLEFIPITLPDAYVTPRYSTSNGNGNSQFPISYTSTPTPLVYNAPPFKDSVKFVVS